ncbi:MAG: hypothetical protein WDA06_01870 [Phenylobacterium sp.]
MKKFNFQMFKDENQNVKLQELKNATILDMGYDESLHINNVVIDYRTLDGRERRITIISNKMDYYIHSQTNLLPEIRVCADLDTLILNIIETYRKQFPDDSLDDDYAIFRMSVQLEPYDDENGLLVGCTFIPTGEVFVMKMETAIKQIIENLLEDEYEYESDFPRFTCSEDFMSPFLLNRIKNKLINGK